MKRIIAGAATCAIALGAVAAPANAAVIGAKDAEDNCNVTLNKAEKEFARDTFDQSKAIGEHERARDFAAAVETVYPGVMAANEAALTGEKADYSAILPAHLVTPYTQAQATLRTTEPTTKTTLEDIDVDSLTVGPATAPAEPNPFTPTMDDTELYEAWADTPSGELAMRQKLIDVAHAAAAASCAEGTAAELEFPTAPITLDKAPEKAPNVAAIVGGVIAAVLAIAGIVAVLPMLGINLPGLPMLGM